MTTYSVNFENQTPHTWTLSIYQLLPYMMDVDVVSWKQVRVPPNGFSGIEWQVRNLVGLAAYKQTGGMGIFMPTQKIPSDLGEKWSCVFEDGVQQLMKDGSAPGGQLVLLNKSLQLANLAIGMDGDITAVKRNVYSGNMAQFVVSPRYYVALFDTISKGEVIRGNQIHGPLEINFQGGQTEKNYVARIEGNIFIFEEAGSGFKTEAPYEQVLERIKELEPEGE